MSTGEVTRLELKPAPASGTDYPFRFQPAEFANFFFYGSNGLEAGRLTSETGQIVFKGDADAAAKVFFDHVIKEHIGAIRELKAERDRLADQISGLRALLNDAATGIDALLIFGHQYTEQPLYREVYLLKRIQKTIAETELTGKEMTLLAADHGGMKYSLAGLLLRAKEYLRRDGDHAKGIGYMLHEEVQKHLKELATRYYAGDITAVDEFLQLYCLGEEERKALKSKPSTTGASHGS